MNLKKIFIYEYDILFDILNEIKEKFNLDIIKADKIKYSQLKNDISNDYLIISGTKQTEMRNHLVIDKKPLKIEKLLELINLKFLKNIVKIKTEITMKLEERFIQMLLLVTIKKICGQKFPNSQNIQTYQRITTMDVH